MADALKVAGIKLTIEGAAEFQNSLSKATSEMKLSAQQLKTLDAQYGKNSTNMEYLTKKQSILSEEFAKSKQKGEQLNRVLEEAIAEYGENSVQADKARLAVEKNATEQAKLEAQLKQVDAEISKQSSSWTQFAEKCKAAGEKCAQVGEAMTKVGTAVAAVGTAAVAALGAISYSAAQAADDLHTMSAQSGFSTEDIQKWQYAADVIDVDVNTIVSSAAKLKKNMASTSKDVAAAFDQLGVAVKDTNGEYRDATTVFYETVEALSRIDNETERDIVAMQLFGKKADSLAGIVDDGGKALREYGQQAEDLGLILGEDLLTASNDLNDTVDLTKAKFSALKNVIGGKIAEYWSPTFDKISAAIDKFIIAVGNVDSATWGTITTVAGLTAGFGLLVAAAGKAVTALGGVLTGLSRLAEAGIAGGAGLAGIISKLKSFAGLAAPLLAVVAAATAIGSACEAAYKKANPLIGQTNEIKSNVKSLSKEIEALNAGIEDNLTASQAEITNCQSLWNELQLLVDANGRVKAGYEDRANFIISTLNSALGTEITMTNGVIQNYGQLASSIDAVIEKKRIEAASSVLDEAYAEQIQKQAEAYGALQTALENQIAVHERYGEATNMAAQRAIQSADETVLNAQRAYDDITSGMQHTEQVMQEVLAGNTSALSKYYGEVSSIDDAIVAKDADSLAKMAAQYEQYRERALATYQAFGNESFRTLAESYDQQANKCREALNQMGSAIDSGLQQANAKTQQGGQQLVNSASSAATQAISAAKAKMNEASGVGSQLVNGMAAGVRNNTGILTSAMRGAVQAAINAAKAAADIHSPSRVFANEVGKWIPAGIAQGITANESYITDALSSTMTDASRFGLVPALRNVSTALSGTRTTDNRTFSSAINVAEMVVREDADINRIAAELYTLIKKANRARGVAI